MLGVFGFLVWSVLGFFLGPGFFCVFVVVLFFFSGSVGFCFERCFCFEGYTLFMPLWPLYYVG